MSIQAPSTEQELQRLESWLPEQHEATRSREIERVIQDALNQEAHLWEREKGLWAAIHRDPFLDLTEQFEFNKWLLKRVLGVMARLLGFAYHFRGLGDEVGNLQALSDAFTDLHSAVMSDEEFFAGGWIQEKAEEAVAADLRGETEEMTSFGD